MNRRVLKKDLMYTSVEDILNKKDPLTYYTKINPETLLRSYNANHYIDGADMVTIPKGTVLTYVKTIEPDLYDIYHVKGQKTCYVAISPLNVQELFDLSMTESTTDTAYRYVGPVYSETDSVLRSNVDMTTTAPSQKKAVSNIRWRLYRLLGKFCYIDNSLVQPVTDFDSEVPAESEPRKCKHCGTLLTDSGECPRCDLGDYDAD